jgi:hypothetical protein
MLKASCGVELRKGPRKRVCLTDLLFLQMFLPLGGSFLQANPSNRGGTSAYSCYYSNASRFAKRLATEVTKPMGMSFTNFVDEPMAPVIG